MKSAVCLVIVLTASIVTARAQAGNGTAPTSDAAQSERRGPGERRMMFGGGNMGTITAIDSGVLTIKTAEGKSVTVKTTDLTRFMGKERMPITLKELKVGDTVMAGGETSGADTVEARMVALVDPQMAQRIADQRAAMGKTVIAGEIKEINETKLTILRPDGQTQVVELDENTSIKKGQESVTLADIKVGDRIYGTGALKDGTFVVKELRTGGMIQMRRREPGETRPDRPKPDQPK